MLQKKSQSGVGLIEVLVTALLIATALLVMMTLQMRSLQYNKGAYFRSQANILAYDIIDLIRLSRDSYKDYNRALNDPIPSVPTEGTASQINAKKDQGEWVGLLSSTLPNGKGGINCNDSRVCSITIQWDEINGSGESKEDTSTFVFTTQI